MPDPTPDQVEAQKKGITKVCLRGHMQSLITTNAIDAPEFKAEVTQDVCPTCGAFWWYATDGRNFHPLVAALAQP